MWPGTGQGVANGKGQGNQEQVICNFIGELTTNNGKHWVECTRQSGRLGGGGCPHPQDVWTLSGRTLWAWKCEFWRV